MLQMKACRILIGLGHSKQLGFAVELAQKRKADRSAGATSLDFAISDLGLGSIVAADAIRQNHCGMTGQIGHYELRAKCGSNDHVHLLKDFDQVDVIVAPT